MARVQRQLRHCHRLPGAARGCTASGQLLNNHNPNNHNPPRVCNAKAQQEAYDQA